MPPPDDARYDRLADCGKMQCLQDTLWVFRPNSPGPVVSGKMPTMFGAICHSSERHMVQPEPIIEAVYRKLGGAASLAEKSRPRRISLRSFLLVSRSKLLPRCR